MSNNALTKPVMVRLLSQSLNRVDSSSMRVNFGLKIVRLEN